jgi:hypothetical protein
MATPGLFGQAPGNPFSVSVQTTDNSLHTLIAAAGSGIRVNITGLIITNESGTATVISLGDGTVTYKIALAANGGIACMIPLIASNPNVAWTVTSSAVVTLDFIVNYLKY